MAALRRALDDAIDAATGRDAGSRAATARYRRGLRRAGAVVSAVARLLPAATAAELNGALRDAAEGTAAAVRARRLIEALLTFEFDPALREGVDAFHDWIGATLPDDAAAREAVLCERAGALPALGERFEAELAATVSSGQVVAGVAAMFRESRRTYRDLRSEAASSRMRRWTRLHREVTLALEALAGPLPPGVTAVADDARTLLGALDAWQDVEFLERRLRRARRDLKAGRLRKLLGRVERHQAKLAAQALSQARSLYARPLGAARRG